MISSGERKTSNQRSLPKLKQRKQRAKFDRHTKKITTQRMKWLFDLINLDSEDFTKVISNKVMSKFNAGYEGLDILKADITEMNPKSKDRFYRHASNVLQKN